MEAVQELVSTLTKEVQPLLCHPLAHSPWLDWALLAVVTAPHLLYAYIWLRPQGWQSFFGKQSIGAFALTATFLKLVTLEVVVMWIWSTRAEGVCLDPSVIQLWQLMAFLLLVAFGQALNVGVFQALGVDGVYYGNKLGAVVERVEGFPFNVTSHPQYLGSVLTVWGLVALLFNQYPEGSTHQISVVLVSVYATILWALTAAMETLL